MGEDTIEKNYIRLPVNEYAMQKVDYEWKHLHPFIRNIGEAKSEPDVRHLRNGGKNKKKSSVCNATVTTACRIRDGDK